MKAFKFSVVVAAVLWASTVSAETLYWQVTSDTGVDFTTAKLVVSDAGSRVELGETLATDLGDSGTGTYVSMQQTDISAYTGTQYSFFVEMVNYATNPETVTQGATYSYQDLLTAGYVSFGADDVTAVTIAAQGANLGASAVPEPSSGSLLLMGGALLALRRRRQK